MSLISKNDLKLKLKDLADRDIALVGDYKGMRKLNTFKFLKCCNLWDSLGNTVFNDKKGCQTCSSRRNISPEEVHKRNITLLDRNIKLISPFTKTTNIHLFECTLKTCGKKWESVYDSVYNKGTRCPKCVGRCKTDEEKSCMIATKILRTRLSTAYYRGKTTSKIYHDVFVYNELFPYWAKQYALIPAKPITDENWELDHIIPVSYFSPNSLTELKLCWNHQNCQWLTKKENLEKSDRIRPQDLILFTDWHYNTYAQCSYPKPLPIVVA